MMDKGMRLTVLLTMLVCLGCSSSNRVASDYDLTGTWEVVDAACVADVPPEVLEINPQFWDLATWERELEGSVRVVQMGSALEIFDFEEAETFVGTVTGDSLEYTLSQDGLFVEGEGVITTADRLAIDHTFTLPAAGASVACHFEAVRL